MATEKYKMLISDYHGTFRKKNGINKNIAKELKMCAGNEERCALVLTQANLSNVNQIGL